MGYNSKTVCCGLYIAAVVVVTVKTVRLGVFIMLQYSDGWLVGSCYRVAGVSE